MKNAFVCIVQLTLTRYFSNIILITLLILKETLINSTLIVEPTDTITALSKKPVDVFNAIVSYRALTELT